MKEQGEIDIGAWHCKILKDKDGRDCISIDSVNASADGEYRLMELTEVAIPAYFDSCPVVEIRLDGLPPLTTRLCLPETVQRITGDMKDYPLLFEIVLGNGNRHNNGGSDRFTVFDGALYERTKRNEMDPFSLNAWDDGGDEFWSALVVPNLRFGKNVIELPERALPEGLRDMLERVRTVEYCGDGFYHGGFVTPIEKIKVEEKNPWMRVEGGELVDKVTGRLLYSPTGREEYRMLSEEGEIKVAELRKRLRDYRDYRNSEFFLDKMDELARWIVIDLLKNHLPQGEVVDACCDYVYSVCAGLELSEGGDRSEILGPRPCYTRDEIVNEILNLPKWRERLECELEKNMGGALKC